MCGCIRWKYISVSLLISWGSWISRTLSMLRLSRGCVLSINCYSLPMDMLTITTSLTLTLIIIIIIIILIVIIVIIIILLIIII